MGYQPEYGQRLSREKYAEELLPYYRIIKDGTHENDAKLGTVGCKPIGVTLASEEVFMPTSTGGMIPRTGYQIGEIPEAQHTGIAFIELGETVVKGELCTSDSIGRGIGAELSASILKTELQSVAGTFLEGGDVGDIVRLDLDNKQ